MLRAPAERRTASVLIISVQSTMQQKPLLNDIRQGLLKGQGGKDVKRNENGLGLFDHHRVFLKEERGFRGMKGSCSPVQTSEVN